MTELSKPEIDRLTWHNIYMQVGLREIAALDSVHENIKAAIYELIGNTDKASHWLEAERARLAKGKGN